MEEIKISGIWNIENKEYKGELYILKNKKIIRLLLTYIDEEDPFGDENTFPEKMDLIYGTSFLDNISITLLDCTTLRKKSYFGSGKKTILIDCNFCIYGLLFKKLERVTFNKIRVRFTNSLEWSNLNGFISSIKNTTRKQPINLKYKFKHKITYRINENAKLEFIPWLGKYDPIMIKTEKVIYEQYMVVEFTYKRVENFVNIMQNLNQILQLIEMSTNLKVEIANMEAFKNSLFYKIPQSNKKNLYKYRIYYSKEEENDFNNNIELTKRDNKFICNLNNIIEVNGLKNWFEKYEDLNPIIRLYNKKFEYDIGIEQEFLNVVQALEFYHTRFVVEDLESYKKNIEEKYKNNPKLLNYIFDNAQLQSDYVVLKSRLIDLILNSNILYFFNPIINFCYFAQSITDTRHYYTHYNMGKKAKALKETELSIATVVLNTLLEYYLLKELGLDEQYLDNLTRNRLNLIKKVVIPYNEQNNKDLYERVNLVTSIKNISKNICKECNLGVYIDEEIIKDKGKDLWFYLITDKGRFKIRIFNKRKTDNDCNNIIKEDKSCLIYTRKHFLEIIYFYERYRVIIYKEK